MVEGRAELVLTTPDGGPMPFADLVAPEVIGPIETPDGGRIVALRALSDCEIVTVEASVAAEVGSRNVELASAVNRMAELRRRRVERIVEHGGLGP